MKMINDNEIEKKRKPTEWMDPHFYKISTAENWPKTNLESGKIVKKIKIFQLNFIKIIFTLQLKNYLEEIYGVNSMAEGMKQNAKEWLRHQMEEWMRMKVANINGGKGRWK